MKTKIFIIASMLIVAVSTSAKQYPDSVRQASKEEPNIAYGWNFEFAGGVGVGRYEYKQIGATWNNPDRHVNNQIHFPSWNAAFGLSYYFVPWMGIGTGVQFSAYTNKAAVTQPWATPADPMRVDPFGDSYVMTSMPRNLTEDQTLYMLEIPITLKFRYRPGVVGLTATAGMKIGLPMMNSYRLRDGGAIHNSVYYPLYDLTIEDVPTVVETLPIASQGGQYEASRWKSINYAAYAELGMLIRVHQRVELALAAYANYYINDVMNAHNATPLAFADGRTAGEYELPYTTPYDGVLRTNEVQTLHPWSVGLKLGVQINANRTKAQRDYDREQRRLRKQKAEEKPVEEEERVEEGIVAKPVVVEEPVIEPTDPREEAIKRIRELAEMNNIDICEVFCHCPDPEPTPVIKEDTVAKKLDEMLKKAVIFFDLDKAIPILEPEDILVRIAEVLKNHPDQKIHVNGHACKLGKPEYNKRLALRRAKAVAEQLKNLGVRDDQMIIASLGADIPYRYNGHHQLSKDRRVEIVPTYRTTEIVRPGSRLAQIARRHYGNPEYWVFIYEANRDQIVDPSNVTPGIELEIPNLSERLKGMNETQAMEEAKRLKAEIMKR